VLPVREAELAVEWLFRDGAQNVSLAAAPDGPLDGTSHGDALAAITVTKP
jgi:hypothetical protein